jgi:hypothetical protein
METNPTRKRNTTIILVFKVVLCLTFLAVEAIRFAAIAKTPDQDSLKYWKLDTEKDPFWEPHCPAPTTTLLDGYTLWMLRQKMTVEAYQTVLNNEINLVNGEMNKIQFANYLPLFGKGNFHSMIGTQYNKFDIQSANDSLNKSIQVVWLWTVWQYKFKRWDFTFSTENMYKGDESTVYAKTGNHSSVYLYIGYEFNNFWNLILMGFYDKQQMNGETSQSLMPGLQARYQPSNKFKLLFGLPTIFAAEWTALPKTDIGMAFYISNESRLFIRQRLSNNVSISLQYSCLWNYSEETYFNSSIYNPRFNTVVAFNRASNLKPQLFADVDFKLYKDIGLSIGAGYNFSSKISLYNNDDRVYDAINSKNNIFVNFSLQFLRRL